MLKGQKMVDDIARKILDLDVLPYPLHKRINAYLSTSSCHQDTKEGKEGLVRDILYSTQSIYAEDCPKSLIFIPGCCLNGKIGPADSCETMIIGRIPAQCAPDNKVIKRNFHPLNFIFGDGLLVLLRAFEEAGLTFDDVKDFYLTNIVRFVRPTISDKGAIRKDWIKESLPFLYQELLLLRPKVILCLGSEPSKHFTGFSVKTAQSNIFDFKRDGVEAKVVCALDPKAVVKSFENKPQFNAGIRLFSTVVSKKPAPKRHENFFYVYSAEELESILCVLEKREINYFALDCEWGGGQTLYDSNARLRTVQLAWSGSEAVVVVLHKEGMQPVFDPRPDEAFKLLRKFLCRPQIRIIGQNLIADFPWLFDVGIDLTSGLFFDTMLASHLFEPTASHSLEEVAVRCISNWRRHDIDLEVWKRGGDFFEKDGFGKVPDAILLPYAARDVCATWLLWRYYENLFKQDENKDLYKLFSSLLIPALPVFIEIERNGVLMDQELLEELTGIFKNKSDVLLAEFRDSIGWADFNPNSDAQKRKFLFEKLRLKPIKTTDKPPMLWDMIEERGLQDLVSPSTDGETLDILGNQNPQVAMLRNICIVETISQNYLPPKVHTENGYAYPKNKGLLGNVSDDGRLRTSYSQMLKTGRLSSRKPNLMNLPKKQETPIARIFSGAVPPLRSAFIAPENRVLISIDYKQAELATLAYLSGDKTLINAIASGQDIHSVVGIQLFRKEGLSPEEFKEKFPNLRITSKNVVFGLLYGRGAIAISRELNKAAIPCVPAEAKEFILRFMSQFPNVKKLIDETNREVRENKWVSTLWGRRKYIYDPGVSGELADSSQNRKGFNFKIQGYVGDLLRKALINFRKYRLKTNLDYRIILTVHDSILLEALGAHAEEIAEKILPLCMVKEAKAPQLGFSIDIDVEISTRWDEKASLDELIKRGLRKEFALRYCKKEDAAITTPTS